MDEIPQVVTNREALKRILAMLVGMAEMGGGTTLPRHLYRAILLLLRPAESAVRRLIIAAARGIVVTLPPFRPRKPKPKISDTVVAMRRLGLAVTLSREDFARYEAELKAAELCAARPRIINLPLLDALKNPFRIRRRYTPAHAAPRILSLFSDAPYHRLPPPPSPNDPIGAARLMLRLEALGRALDDLPAQAQRFARWRARNDAAWARDVNDHGLIVGGKSPAHSTDVPVVWVHGRYQVLPKPVDDIGAWATAVSDTRLIVGGWGLGSYRPAMWKPAPPAGCPATYRANPAP